MIGQRRIPNVHIVHAGIDERRCLEQWRYVPVLLNGRQPLAEGPSAYRVARDERTDAPTELPGDSHGRHDRGQRQPGPLPRVEVVDLLEVGGAQRAGVERDRQDGSDRVDLSDREPEVDPHSRHPDRPQELLR